MDEDNPDYLVHEIFTQNFWKDHPLGKPILGTKETVRHFEQETLFDYYGQRFRRRQHDLLRRRQSRTRLLRREGRRAASNRSLPGSPSTTASPRPSTHSRISLRNKKSLEQVQLCLGVPSPPIAHAQRYVTLVLNTVLGGGMSSRLFQTVREERGLAYSIYSDLNPYRDTGSLCVYAGTSSSKAVQVIELIMAEFRRLKEEAAPCRRTPPRQRPAQRQHPSLPRKLHVADVQPRPPGDVLPILLRHAGDPRQNRSVTAEQVMEMAQSIFKPEEVAVTLLGRLDGLKVTRKELAC